MGTTDVAIVVALVLVAVVGIARFELFCLRDLARSADTDLNYLTRQGWTVLIVCAIPLGGAAYLYCGRRR